jgi:hypothetical protein
MSKTTRSAARAASVILLLFLTAATAVAQRPGSAANGGSVRPERVPPKPAPASTPTPTPTPLGATGKPTLTRKGECDPETVIGTCPGTYSFGYGFTANAAPRHGGAQTEKAGFAFSVYVTRRISLEIDNDNVLSSVNAPAERVTGFGDTSLYVGWDALLEAKGRPGISLVYGVKLPTASSRKGLGSGEVDHTLLGLVGKTLDKSYIEFDVGDYIAHESGAGGFDHFPFASAFLNQKLGSGKKYKLHFEVGGDFATSKSNADMYTLDYLETKLSDHFALRTGARFGLTPNVSRAGLYLALKVSGRLK